MVDKMIKISVFVDPFSFPLPCKLQETSLRRYRQMTYKLKSTFLRTHHYTYSSEDSKERYCVHSPQRKE